MSDTYDGGQPMPKALAGALPTIPLAHAALTLQDEKGMAKYGTTLYVPNGRDFGKDGTEEAADNLNYAVGAEVAAYLLKKTLAKLLSHSWATAPIGSPEEQMASDAHTLIHACGGIDEVRARTMGYARDV